MSGFWSSVTSIAANLSENPTWEKLREGAEKLGTQVADVAESGIAEVHKLADRQLLMHGISSLEEEIESTKKDWGSMSWDAMCSGETAAVQSNFETAKAIIDDLQKQVDEKRAALEELDSEATVHVPDSQRAAGPLPGIDASVTPSDTVDGAAPSARASRRQVALPPADGEFGDAGGDGGVNVVVSAQLATPEVVSRPAAADARHAAVAVPAFAAMAVVGDAAEIGDAAPVVAPVVDSSAYIGSATATASVGGSGSGAPVDSHVATPSPQPVAAPPTPAAPPAAAEAADLEVISLGTAPAASTQGAADDDDDEVL